MGKKSRVLSPSFVAAAMAVLSSERAMTTAEVAACAHYSKRHTVMQLAVMQQQGLVRQTATHGKKGRKRARLYLWELPVPSRTCTCGHTGPETDFYPDLKRGTGWYTGCKVCRKAKSHRDYIRRRTLRELAAA